MEDWGQEAAPSLPKWSTGRTQDTARCLPPSGEQAVPRWGTVALGTPLPSWGLGGVEGQPAAGQGPGLVVVQEVGVQDQVVAVELEEAAHITSLTPAPLPPATLASFDLGCTLLLPPALPSPPGEPGGTNTYPPSSPLPSCPLRRATPTPEAPSLSLTTPRPPSPSQTPICWEWSALKTRRMTMTMTS